MKEKVISAIKKLTLLSLLLFIGYSCSDSTRDYLDEYEIRRMIEEEIRKNNQDLDKDEILRMINEEIRKNNQDLVFTNLKIVPISVKKSDWEWFDDVERYEVVFDLPLLTEEVYESGVQIASVFIGEQGVDEVQKTLPYLHTYYHEDDQGSPKPYTETISCDYQLGTPSTVAFYIQASDLGRDDSNLANYNFRIVLVW